VFVSYHLIPLVENKWYRNDVPISLHRALISVLYIWANLVPKARVEQKNKSQTRRTRIPQFLDAHEVATSATRNVRSVVPLGMDDWERWRACSMRRYRRRRRRNAGGQGSGGPSGVWLMMIDAFGLAQKLSKEVGPDASS
jgi:hypothetical protein